MWFELGKTLGVALTATGRRSAMRTGPAEPSPVPMDSGVPGDDMGGQAEGRGGLPFGFASAQVLDFADLYAGKLAAALSRQHPRDLFDIGPLLDDERTDVTLWWTFLIYLTCSSKPAWEILAPREPTDFEATFNAHFKGSGDTDRICCAPASIYAA